MPTLKRTDSVWSDWGYAIQQEIFDDTEDEWFAYSRYLMRKHDKKDSASYRQPPKGFFALGKKYPNLTEYIKMIVESDHAQKVFREIEDGYDRNG